MERPFEILGVSNAHLADQLAKMRLDGLQIVMKLVSERIQIDAEVEQSDGDPNLVPHLQKAAKAFGECAEHLKAASDIYKTY